MNEIKKAFKKITPHRLDEIKEELKYRDENIVVETKKEKKTLSLCSSSGCCMYGYGINVVAFNTCCGNRCRF